jgi:hypothetical protein
MNDQLKKLLTLPDDATEADTLQAVAALVAYRKQVEDHQAFEQRILNLQRVTGMIRDEAIKCLRRQDANGHA